MTAQFKKLLTQFELNIEELELLKEAAIIVTENYIKKQYGVIENLSENQVISAILHGRIELRNAYNALVAYMYRTTDEFVKNFQEAKKSLDNIDGDE
jgi:hypothetical protein